MQEYSGDGPHTCLVLFACLKRYELVWFKNQTYTFNLLPGGDGAPFGKDDTSRCCLLVSFLNLGRKFLGSNENYLLF